MSAHNRPDGSAEAALQNDLDIVNQILGHRLRQDDIKRILETLSADDRASFTDKLADILRKTSALLEVSRRVSDSLSLDVLLPRMVDIISEFLVADRATLFLHDAADRALYSRVAQGDLMNEIRIPDDVGIAGSVFTTKESVIIQDAYADPRFNADVDKKTGYRTRNILCAPIRTSQGEVIGASQVLNKHGGDDFTNEDLRLLEAITSQAAAAFVNAQLMEQINRAREEESQLLEVTNAISRELNLEPLLHKIMEAVTVILNADRSTLFMYDAKTHELWSHVAQGLDTAEIRFPADKGIAGTCFTTGETINIPDAYADQRFNQEVDKQTGYKTDSILCMTVVSKSGETLGVMQVLNKRGGPFGVFDERRLRAFTSQAAIAIENAKLFEDVTNIKNYNESILESMSNGVITLDADDRLVKANAAARRMFRKEGKTEEMLERSVGDFLGDGNPWVLESVARVKRSGEPDVAMDADLALRPPGSDAPDERRRARASVNLQVVPLKSSKSEHLGCMLVIEDITTEKRIRGTMARYMNKELADKLLEDGAESLGGKAQRASVLFSDIRRFTSISERLGAQETVKMLNAYFSVMVDIVLENGGILDKYIGDAIMAVFGAPFQKPEDADNAVRAAVGMMRGLREFNRRQQEAGQETLMMGLGINTDEVLSGNIGSAKRMDYTVIGDGVNLASRLEGANKPYGTQILISEFTYRELTGLYRTREVDRIRVKGKQEPVAIYEVLDHLETSEIPHLDDVISLFDTGLEHYRRRDWQQATRIFDEALLLHPQDQVSRLYRDRCQHFVETPPPPDWDGVWVMTSK